MTTVVVAQGASRRTLRRVVENVSPEAFSIMSPWIPLLAVCVPLAFAGDVASDPCDVASFKQVLQTPDRAAVTRFASWCGTEGLELARPWKTESARALAVSLRAWSAWPGAGRVECSLLR